MANSLPVSDNPTSRVLLRRYYLQPNTTMLSQLLIQVGISDKILDSYGWQGRRVLGYKLPEWQRDAVWTTDQAKRFIESIFLGVGLGTYMVNLTLKNHEADMILLDGQQRLRAIERYWADEFGICGEDGKEYSWSELTSEEKAHFLRIPFGWCETSYTTDRDLRDAYNRHNFGGTPHTPEERA